MTTDPGKPLSTGMRWMLVAASVLVFSVGISLFLLTEKTDKYFAWTIANPLTAAFLGAGYWASGMLEFLASRERYWANARIAVPAVIVFTVLTLLVTLIHWDRFHFHDPAFVARSGTYFWLAVYASVPVIMLAALIQIGWKTNATAMPERSLPKALYWIALAQGTVMFVFGLLLLVLPTSVDQLWPWSLTELTARATGAWLVSFGVAAFHSVCENDLRRVRAILFSYVAFAVLLLVALLRYPDVPDWGAINIWLYLAFVVSMLGLGLVFSRLSFAMKEGGTS